MFNKEDCLGVDWKYLVNRKESLLFSSITDNSYHKLTSLTGINWKATKILKFKNGNLFHSSKELSALENYFMKDPLPRLNKFKEDLIKYVGALDKEADKISRMNLDESNNDDLLDVAVDFFNVASSAHNFLLPVAIANKLLSRMIIDKLDSFDNKQDLLFALTFPREENFYVLEERSFYQLAKSYAEHDADFDLKLNKHLAEFSWIGARGYNFDTEWDKDLLLKRIKEFLDSGKNPLVELENLERIRNKIIDNAEKLFNENKLYAIPDFSEIVALSRDFAFLKTWRTDIIYRAGIKVKNLFNKIIDILDLSITDLMHSSYTEILDSLKKGELVVSKDEIDRRKNNFISLFWNGEYFIVTDEEIIDFLSTNILSKSDDELVISGNAVYPGVVEGKAVLVLKPEDVDKVKKGDILVSVMTFPQFIMAMERAGAFVTDEGGILCHAAIVAREMKKPCVIATKKATKVIKSGDYLRVDANKGVVEILNRS